MEKFKKYLKNVNPYLLASAAVVGVSALIIFFLVTGENPTQDKEILVIEESVDCESEETEEPVLDQVTESEALEESDEMSGEIEESTVEDEVTVEQESIKDKDVEQESQIATEEAKEFSEEDLENEKQPEESKEPKKPEEEEQPEVRPEESEAVPEEPDITPEEPDTTPEESEFTPEEPEVHEHSWIFESYYQKPTCSNGGLVNEVCAHCGETQITGGTPTGEHFFEVETVGDCCSAEVAVCTECNYREVREKDSANHIDVEDGFCYGCGHSTE